MEISKVSTDNGNRNLFINKMERFLCDKQKFEISNIERGGNSTSSGMVPNTHEIDGPGGVVPATEDMVSNTHAMDGSGGVVSAAAGMVPNTQEIGDPGNVIPTAGAMVSNTHEIDGPISASAYISQITEKSYLEMSSYNLEREMQNSISKIV